MAFRGLTLWRTVMKDHTRERLQGGTGQRRRLQGAVHLRTLRARLVVREVHEHALERRHASFLGRHHQRGGTDGQPLTRLLTSHRSPTPPFPPPRQCACSTARVQGIWKKNRNVVFDEKVIGFDMSQEALCGSTPRSHPTAHPGAPQVHTQDPLEITPGTHSTPHPGPTREHTQSTCGGRRH